MTNFSRSALLSCAALLGLAACSGTPEQTPPSMTTISITTPTIQCDMCVETITTAVKAVAGVDSVGVDLDAKVTVVRFASTTATQAQVEDAIVKAGYDANGKQRDMKAYDGLPGCCKLPEGSEGTTVGS